MKPLLMNHSDSNNLETAQNGNASLQNFVRRIPSVLAGLGLSALALILGLIVLRIGAAVFMHHRIANAGSDLARVSGLDPRMSFWLEGPASWILAFGISSIFLRTIWMFVWPFGKTPRTLYAALILFGLTESAR